jgi:hypothetical protein
LLQSPLRFLQRDLSREPFQHPEGVSGRPFKGRGEGSLGPLFLFLPVFSLVTPEVEVSADRRPRRGRKAEAEREREAEPGELLS